MIPCLVINVTVFAAVLVASPAAAAERQNIVVIVLDDLGNADLGYRGSPMPHETLLIPAR
jgi:hypothetical protein